MIKKIFCVFIAIVMTFTFCSCSNAVITEGGVKDSNTGIEYVVCRSVFAVKKGEVLLTDDQGNEYCRIINENPERFICDNDDALPYVYRYVNEPAFTVELFDPISAQIWLEGTNNSTLVGTLMPETKYLEPYWEKEEIEKLEAERLAEKTIVEQNGETYYADYDYVYAIRDTIVNDEIKKVGAPTVQEMDIDYTVHFRLLSAEYPGLYYEVVFWRDINGINYLYDRENGNSYLCPYAVTYYLWENM